MFKLSKLLQAIESHTSMLARLGRWIVTLGGAAVLGGTAKVAQVLEEFAPFSYLLAGFIGAALVAIVFACWASFRSATANARYLNELKKPASAINPLDESFNKKRIEISDLADPVTNVVKDKTFTNCQLVGPRTAVFLGCTFQEGFSHEGCDFATFDDQGKPPSVYNIQIFHNCTFRNCRYFRLVMFFRIPRER